MKSTNHSVPLNPAIIQGRYKVERVFKSTSSRRVVEATDLESNFLVVLKSASGEEYNEMLAESFLLADISSPYVVRLLDRFDERGIFFEVIEMYEETTLSDVLAERGGRLVPEEAVQVSIHLLQAFAAMHAKGILHRDLNTDHFAYRDPHHLKLFDLNLAFRAEPGTDVVRLNPHPNGTWETMAPEEFEAESKITPASNVYSAAAILYRLLVGNYPHDFKIHCSDWSSLPEEDQKGLQCTLHRTRNAEYPPSVPSCLVPVLQQALAKKSSDRFQTVREFSEALSSAWKKQAGTLYKEREGEFKME